MQAGVAQRTKRAGSGAERPRARVWTAAELAQVLGVSPELVAWHCSRAQALGRAALFFGCWKEGEEWMIPERAAARLARDWSLQHYSVAEVAALTSLQPATVRRRVVIVPGHVDMERGRPVHALGARLFFGEWRIPRSELERLLAGGLPEPRREA